MPALNALLAARLHAKADQSEIPSVGGLFLILLLLGGLVVLFRQVTG